MSYHLFSSKNPRKYCISFAVIAFSLINAPLKAENTLPVSAISPSEGEIPIDYYRDEVTGDVWGTEPAWRLPLPSNGTLPIEDMWKYGLRSIYLAKYACMDEEVRQWMPINIVNGIYYCTNPENMQQTIHYLRTLADQMEADLNSSDESDSPDSTNPIPSSPKDVEPSEFAGIVEAHNVWRRQVGVPDIRWSSEVAIVAQEWTNELKSLGCSLEHNPSSSYGENIFWGSTSYTPEEVVNTWGNDITYYDYATNSCQPNETCGHYTQVVWHNTEEVGCGKASCGSVEVWVCNYYPPGNYIGQKPY